MSADSKFGLQYLQSLLRTSPGSAEELSQVKQKIELHFRSMEKNQKKPAAISGAKSSPGKTAVTRTRNRKNDPIERVIIPSASEIQGQRFVFMIYVFGFVLVAAPLTVKAAHTAFSPFPYVMLLIIGLGLWKQRVNFLTKFTGLKDPELQRLALAGLKGGHADSHIPQWARRCGESDVSDFQQKWADLDRYINQVLEAGDLQSTFGPAEEGLSILNYFNRVRQTRPLSPQDKSHANATEIDPLNTLIERLIEDHEWKYADQLSQHYLGLLNPEHAFD